MQHLWQRAITQPNEENFTLMLKESQPVDFGEAAKWVVIASIVGGIGSGIGTTINNLISGESLWIGAASGVGGAIGGMLGFFVGTAIIVGVAKLFKGEGTYVEQAYLGATWQVPLLFINAILSLIPVVGLALASLVGLYSFYLNILTVKVVHKFEWPKAIGVVLLPAVIIFVCVCGGIFTLAMVGAGVGGVFDEIQRSLQP